MFKVQITYQAPDIDRWEFEFPCPICRLTTTITVGQARREEYFICRGCHSTIKAIDHLGGMQRLKQIMQDAFR
jgi:hypothetical protein